MLYFLLLIGFLAYTSAASVPSTVNTERDLTLSGPAQSNSSVAESDIWLSYCTKTERWSLPELNPDDCSGVLDYFYIETVDKDHRGSKEFRSPKAKKKAQAKTQWTPRKYTFGRPFLPAILIPKVPSKFPFCIYPNTKNPCSQVPELRSPKRPAYSSDTAF